MKRIFCFLLLVMIRGAAAQAVSGAASPAAGPARPVVVLSSEDIKHVPRAEHVHKILRLVAAELQVARREMPHIVMMYVHRSEANTQHLPKVSIAVEQARNPGRALYHVWIVDDVRDLATAQGLVMALNDNFDLQMDDDKVHQARDRVCSNSAITVDYHDLADGK